MMTNLGKDWRELLLLERVKESFLKMHSDYGLFKKSKKQT